MSLEKSALNEGQSAILGGLNERAGRELNRLSYHQFVFGYSASSGRDAVFPPADVAKILGRSCKNMGRVSDAEYHEAGDILFGPIDKTEIQTQLRDAMASSGFSSVNDIPSVQAMGNLVKTAGFESFKLLYTAFDPTFKTHTKGWRLEDHRRQLAQILEDRSYVELPSDIKWIVDDVGAAVVARSLNN